MMPFTFDHQKATQALTYLASKQGGPTNKMKALKVIFFADRYHFRRFGRPITGDTYFAMDYGPVPSGTKDIAESSAFLGGNERDYAKGFIQTIDNLTFQKIAAPDTRLLSRSDVSALNWAWAKFGDMDQYQLADYTHKYPEWLRWEEQLKSSSRISMEYQDFLEDPQDADPCYPLSSEAREAMLEGLRETVAFEAKW